MTLGIYTDKPETIDAVEKNILCVILDIRSQFLQKWSKIESLSWNLFEITAAYSYSK